MKLHEVREHLLKAIRNLHALKNNPNNATTLKDEIDRILALFTKKEIEDIKLKISQRKKKRLRIQRKQSEWKRHKDEQLSMQKKNSIEADTLLLQCRERDERIKTEESVRRQADAVLHEVTRRKAEARRILAVLPALSKLRVGRSQRHAANGGRPSAEAAEAFESALQHLRGLWERQLEVYGVEEAGIKVMLDEGSATKLGRAEREVDDNLHQWHMALFGEGSFPELSWHQLVSIRRTWDQYVVPAATPMSSNLTPGWILPQSIEREDWKRAVIFK